MPTLPAKYHIFCRRCIYQYLVRENGWLATISACCTEPGIFIVILDFTPACSMYSISSLNVPIIYILIIPPDRPHSSTENRTQAAHHAQEHQQRYQRGNRMAVARPGVTTSKIKISERQQYCDTYETLFIHVLHDTRYGHVTRLGRIVILLHVTNHIFARIRSRGLSQTLSLRVSVMFGQQQIRQAAEEGD